MSDILVVDTLSNQEKINDELSQVKQELVLMKDRLLSQTIEEEKVKQELKDLKEKHSELQVITKEKMKQMQEDYHYKITELEEEVFMKTQSFTQYIKEQESMYQNKIRELEREIDGTSFFSMI
jgi:hypothetical protein